MLHPVAAKTPEGGGLSTGPRSGAMMLWAGRGSARAGFARVEGPGAKDHDGLTGLSPGDTMQRGCSTRTHNQPSRHCTARRDMRHMANQARSWMRQVDQSWRWRGPACAGRAAQRQSAALTPGQRCRVAAPLLSTPGMGDRLGVKVPWRMRWC